MKDNESFVNDSSGEDLDKIDEVCSSLKEDMVSESAISQEFPSFKKTNQFNVKPFNMKVQSLTQPPPVQVNLMANDVVEEGNLDDLDKIITELEESKSI